MTEEKYGGDPFEFMHAVNREFIDRKKDFNILAENYIDRHKTRGKQAYIDMGYLMGYIAHKYKINTHFQSQIHLGGVRDGSTVGKDAFSLAMFATWRLKPYVFEIDDDLFEQIKKSPIPFESPVSIFDNLPAWAVYVQLSNHELSIYTPAHEIIKLKCYGFWAYKAYSGEQLWLYMYPHVSQDDMTKTVNIQKFLPTSFLIINEKLDLFESLKKALEKMMDKKQEQHIPPEIWDMHLNNSRLFLSALLLLCVERPQIEDSSLNEVDIASLSHLPPIHPKTKRFIAPNEPTKFFIGRRLGGQIRAFKAQESKGMPTGVTMQPHVRQAHWHGYRYGEGRKQFKLTFLPPIFVNMHAEDNLEERD